MNTPTIKDKCRAVVRLDRAEVAYDAARDDLYHAAKVGEPVRGYYIAFHIALTMLGRVRAMPYGARR